ncbi:MAG TPA: 3-hydroxyacyl-CoA dehydrogenase NAD-binding domain-containing protein [Gemmatimonadales bacterium]|nr:3-hydroxyacyl-CoA dehydrogenase NAD-binding domain-containing protein [Gemmatimonadales bacterium]
MTHPDVAVIGFTNPPVNGLSHAVRARLAIALEEAIANPSVRAIVLTGDGRQFSGGADIREFGTEAKDRAPNLRQLIAQVESSPKPVVAAITGICLGGGFELAMAAHHRVAARDARLGLPEVKLGLLPGAGGTQRLPRLLGVERAIDMIVGGEPVAARRLEATPLLDRVTEGDPMPEAIALAQASAAAGPPRRTRDRRVPDPDVAERCAAARHRLRQGRALPAPLRAIDAIEASAGDFETGLALERQAFLELVESPESKGLRHAFFAERAAGKVPGLGDPPLRPVTRAAVIGGGTMGSGIAVCFLNAGLPVTLLETDAAALDRAIGRIGAIYDGQVKKGKLTVEERDRRLALLTPTLQWDDLVTADLAIEAVFESMEVKEDVFARLDRVMTPGAILATNTSTLDIDRIAERTSRPGDVLGMHFFSPAHVMRLLEVVRGRATAPDALLTALALGKRLGKVAVVAGVGDGFIGNRMLEQYMRQAFALVEEGAAPSQVDRAVETFGMAMGPFRVSDLVGNDVSWAIRKRRRAERPGYQFSTLPDRLCELGRFGQKTGDGWYDYTEGSREPRESAVVAELIARHRAALGSVPRPLTDQEIVARLMGALASEGERILEEGVALRASDIDVVYVAGYGFPAWRGGPMFYAGRVG